MNTNALIEKLADSKLMIEVRQEDVKELVEREVGQTVSYKKGETIVSQGQPFTSLCVLVGGKVYVERVFEDGTEVMVKILNEGMIFGGEVVRNPHSESKFYYRAAVPVTVYSFDQEVFDDPEFCANATGVRILKNLIKILEHENHEKHKRIDILSASTIKGKLLAFLNYEAERKHSREFDLPFTKEKLARYLCVNRSALSREMTKLEEEGYFTYKGKHFTLLK